MFRISSHPFAFISLYYYSLYLLHFRFVFLHHVLQVCVEPLTANYETLAEAGGDSFWPPGLVMVHAAASDSVRDLEKTRRNWLHAPE